MVRNSSRQKRGRAADASVVGAGTSAQVVKTMKNDFSQRLRSGEAQVTEKLSCRCFGGASARIFERMNDAFSYRLARCFGEGDNDDDNKVLLHSWLRPDGTFYL